MKRPDVLLGGVSVATLIASGSVTRENSCDGKVTFSRYAKAHLVAEEKSKIHGVRQYAYACPFCSKFHIATDKKP